MRHFLLISALLVSPLFGGEQIQKSPVQKSPVQKVEKQKMSRREAILNLRAIYSQRNAQKTNVRSCCGAINPWCQKAQDARDRAIAARMAEVQKILRNQQ